MRAWGGEAKEEEGAGQGGYLRQQQLRTSGESGLGDTGCAAAPLMMLD